MRGVHPEVTVVAAKPVVNVSTTLGIVIGMQTIPISPDMGLSTGSLPLNVRGTEGRYQGRTEGGATHLTEAFSECDMSE